MELWNIWPSINGFLVVFLRFIPVITVMCCSCNVSIFYSLYCWVIFYHKDITHFVYPFLNWQTFGLFPFLTIMNYVAMNILIQAFVWTYVFSSLGIYPGVELLGHMVTLFLHFDGLSSCFPKWLHHFTIQPTIYEDSESSVSLSTLNYLSSLF